MYEIICDFIDVDDICIISICFYGINNIIDELLNKGYFAGAIFGGLLV